MLFINPSFDPNLQYAIPTRQPLQFHKRLLHYSPTPLHAIPQLAEQFGVAKLFVKDESSRLGLPAFKILGASWAAYRVLCEKYRDKILPTDFVEEIADKLKSLEPISLYAATDGNHGRAVARVGKLFGLPAFIYVPKGTALARVSAIESEGARVTIIDGTYDDAVAMAASEATIANGLLIQDNSWEGYQIIPRYVVEGYSTMLWEIDDALTAINEQQPTHVFVQIGNGSFAEAVVRHYRAKNIDTSIIGIEPNSAACVLKSVKAGKIIRLSGPFDSLMVGMNCDSPSLISFPVMQKGMNAFISLSDEQAMEAMKLLSKFGIVSGETGAAGTGTLLEIFSADNRIEREWLRLNRKSRVLVFSTEGVTNEQLYQKIVAEK
jgi:diaminopropionate ammonia-lyase